MKARSIASSLALVGPYILAFVACEVLLRTLGTSPRPNDTKPGILKKHLESATLGWTPAEGTFTHFVPASGRETSVTNWSNGGRATREQEQKQQCSLEIVLLGGSLIQGFGLADSETLAWKLQAMLPRTKVENFAVGGYGGFQSLLRLEQDLSRETWCPRVYVYGIAPFHEERNVGAPLNLIEWSKNSSTGSILVPVTQLIDSTLTRGQYRAMPNFPLRTRLALVSVLEDLFLWAQPVPPKEQQRKIAYAILEEMNAQASEQNASFLAFLIHFHAHTKADYIEHLSAMQIPYLDASPEYAFSSKYQLLYDTHPNERMTSEWAKLLAREVNKRFDS